MPFIQKQKDDERLKGLQIGPNPVVSSFASPGGAAQEAAPKGSGFVNISRYLDANRGQGAAMGAKLAQGAQQSLDNAHQSIEENRQNALLTGQNSLGGAGEAAAAAKKASEALSSPEKTAGALRETYGATSAGGGALDAALVRAESQPQTQNLSEQWAGINDFLGYSRNQVANQAAPMTQQPLEHVLGAPRKAPTKQGLPNTVNEVGRIAVSNPLGIVDWMQRKKKEQAR